MAPTSASTRSRKASRPASAPGSTARIAWPRRGRLPSSAKKPSASKPKAAPVRAQQSSSTTSASSAPLVPPAASMAPPRAACGSVVGSPAASMAQPGGIGRPSFAAAMIRPRATFDRARSTTSGSVAPRRGKAAATGLVPSSGRRPPGTGMAAGELVKASATKPCRARASAGSPIAPEWWLLVTPRKATPWSRARRAASATARSSAG